MGRVGSSLLEQAETGGTRQSARTEVRLLAREWCPHGAEMVRVVARGDTRSNVHSIIGTIKRYHGHHQSHGDFHDRRR
jgi:hypothetical protein